jgi:hypothetical protein
VRVRVNVRVNEIRLFQHRVALGSPPYGGGGIAGVTRVGLGLVLELGVGWDRG